MTQTYSLKMWSKNIPNIVQACLAEYGSNYKTVAGQQKKTKKAQIIRYVNFNRHKDPEAFYRQHCLLYLPFIESENTLLHEVDSWHEHYNTNINLITQNKAKFTKTISLDETQQSAINSTNKTGAQRLSSSSKEETHTYDLALDIHTLRQ